MELKVNVPERVDATSLLVLILNGIESHKKKKEREEKNYQLILNGIERTIMFTFTIDPTCTQLILNGIESDSIPFTMHSSSTPR